MFSDRSDLMVRYSGFSGRGCGPPWRPAIDVHVDGGQCRHHEDDQQHQHHVDEGRDVDLVRFDQFVRAFVDAACHRPTPLP